jgi:hypothetical protein
MAGRFAFHVIHNQRICRSTHHIAHCLPRHHAPSNCNLAVNGFRMVNQHGLYQTVHGCQRAASDELDFDRPNI